MPGPKYCADFDHPSNFGFTASAGQVPVRPHLRSASGGGKMARGGRPKNWIQDATTPSKKGALHRALGVPEGEKIPRAKIAKAEKSTDPHVQHMAQFAANVPHKARGGVPTFGRNPKVK